MLYRKTCPGRWVLLGALAPTRHSCRHKQKRAPRAVCADCVAQLVPLLHVSANVPVHLLQPWPQIAFAGFEKRLGTWQWSQRSCGWHLLARMQTEGPCELH